jgi:2-phosphosulfolactate phosphatase
MDWGAEGLAALAQQCAVLVLVDVLSFTTSVDIAVGRGARIVPLPMADDAAVARARAGGAVIAGERGWTLRPASLLDIPAGTRLAVPSPNGATLCVRAVDAGATVFAGCLRNASAVALAAVEAAGGRPIGVLACGERWGVRNGPLRPAVEDLIGAGAVIAELLAAGVGPASPEALVAAGALRTATEQPGGVAGLLTECVSGRELIGWDHGADVALAAQREVSGVAPRLVDGELTA